jgi:predicted TIM-barrel fold metal-dependent hydrolase
MPDRQKVYDADTHFQPSAESIMPYLSKAMQDRLPEFKEQMNPVKFGRAGQINEPPYRHWFRFGERAGGWGSNKPRRLGNAGPVEGDDRGFQQFMGEKFPTDGGEDYDIQARLKDMDEEGVDIQLMVPGTFTGHPEPQVNIEFIRAAHRFIDDSSRAAPDRLKSLITVTVDAIEDSVEEIKTWAGSSWARGVFVSPPLNYPLDHPDLNPIWAAADEANMCVVHHSNSAGYPGYRDLWDNPFLGRTAGHPWGAQRAVAAFFGAGIMDRYPNVRFAVLECGFGWLPHWAKRMDDQVIYLGFVAENLQHKMSEYMTGGRFFTSIVLHEGGDMVRLVSEILGDHILMFGSDYPHAESRFPGSVKAVDDWSMPDDRRAKLMFDNAAKCFGL